MKTPEGVEQSEGPVKGVGGVKLADKAYLEVQDFDLIKSDRPFTIAAWFRLGDGKSGMIAGQMESLGGEVNNDERGWQLEISGGRPSLQLIGEREFELGLAGDKDTPKANEGEWHHVVATYDGKRRRSGMHLYFDGRPVDAKSTGRAIHEVEGEIGRAVPLTLGGRMGSDGEVVDTFDGAISDFRILNREASAAEAKLLYGWADIRGFAAKKPKKAREGLEEYYLTREYEPYRQAMERVARLEVERRDIIARNPLTYVMHEKADSKPMAHVLFRGMYDQPRDEAPAATPSVLPPMAADLPRNRMGLAKWLMDDQNPLTARVTVNRMWQEVFGFGIVLTAEDFGSQGQAPINPGLLDWLAVDFRESGWNVKAFYKQLLMSAAYRQSAVTTPAKIEKDPKDRLLSRGPRFRMDGEVLRDYALAASGLLNDKIGGRSVLPYQPDGVWESVAMRQSNTKFYEPDSGAALYRRSLYTFWKRAAPPPSMLTFDAPTRESCTVRRERTNTPLQALVTMNDPQFFEAARQLAENAQAKTQDLDARLDFMAERLLARPLEEREIKIIEASYHDFLRHYDSNLDDAKRMLAVGESKPDLGQGPAELAALTMAANQMLNLDEVLNK